MAEHVCEVCFRPASAHATLNIDHARSYFPMLPPCCPGCPCGSATPTEDNDG